MSLLKSALSGAFFIAALSAGIFGAYTLDQHNRAQQAALAPIVITNDPGGVPDEFYDRYTKARHDGKRYVIDGWCISACTMILGLIPEDRVCVTPYAKFAFHSASRVYVLTGERVGHSKEWTRIIWQVYPPKVRDMLKSKGWDGMAEYPPPPLKKGEKPALPAEHPELIYVEGDELLTLIAPCKKD
jgi:hypothetical protein